MLDYSPGFSAGVLADIVESQAGALTPLSTPIMMLGLGGLDLASNALLADHARSLCQIRIESNDDYGIERGLPEYTCGRNASNQKCEQRLAS
jgi:hypothetical protein